MRERPGGGAVTEGERNDGGGLCSLTMTFLPVETRSCNEADPPPTLISEESAAPAAGTDRLHLHHRTNTSKSEP